jgi:hypothetical protein
MNTINPVLDSNFNEDLIKKRIDIISVNKFLILFVLSFGLYSIWWMYKVWRFFKEKDSLDILPVWRAFFSIFFTYSLFDTILKYSLSNGYTKSYQSSSLFAGYILSSIVSNFLPDPYWLLGLLSAFFFVPPIEAFNFSIENSESHEAETSEGFNGRQIVVLVAGVAFWILVLMGLFVDPA